MLAILWRADDCLVRTRHHAECRALRQPGSVTWRMSYESQYLSGLRSYFPPGGKGCRPKSCTSTLRKIYLLFISDI